MKRSASEVLTATVMFTDVVDSTATRSRIGEELADKVFARNDRLVRAIARAHGASLTKNLGDGLMAVFGSATAAVRSAIAVEFAIQEENARSDVPLRIRVGLSTGDVQWAADDVTGLPVIEAARLADRASPGQVLCTEIAARLAEGRANVECVPVGSMDLKGLAGPLHAYEILWSRATAPHPPAGPEWITEHPLLALVGRDGELAQLSESFDPNASVPRLVAICGEAGIGKTRLLAEFARLALDRGYTLLIGRATDPPTRPFQPIAEAVENLATSAPSALLRIDIPGAIGPLVRLTPLLSEPPFGFATAEVDDGPNDSYRLATAFAQMIESLSDVSPVVVMIDDLHWASPATIRLLRAVLQQVRAPSLLVVAFRDTRLDTEPEVARELASLLAMPHATQIALPALGVDHAFEALGRLAAFDEPFTLAEQLVDLTAGNPYFLAEAIRELLRGGTSGLEELPETVSRSIVERLQKCDPVARDAIDLIGVAGRLEAFVLRSAVAALDDETFVTAIEAALDTGLVVERSGGVLAVAHELARRAVTDAQSEARRALLHRRIASALLQSDPLISLNRPYLLAEHLYAARDHSSRAELADVVALCAASGRHATAQLAHLEAVDWYRRALQIHAQLGDATDGTRAELLLGIGDAMWRAGSPEAQQTLLEAASSARSIGRDDIVVAAALAGNRGFFSSTAATDPKLIELLSGALDLSEPGTATRAELMARLAAELTWAADGEHRFDLSNEAVAIARSCGDPRTLTTVLGLRLLTISAADTLDQRLAESEEMERAADMTSDPLLRLHALFQRTGPLLEIGDTRSVAKLLDEAGKLARALALPHMEWLVEFSSAGLLLMRGEIGMAEAAAEGALNTGRAAGRRGEAMAFYSEQVAEIRRLQGRLDELVAGLRVAASRNLIDPVHSVLRYLCEADDDEAPAIFDTIVDAGGIPPRRDLAQRAALDNLSLAAFRLGRPDVMSVLYEALLPFADSFGHGAVCHQCGHHFLALLATGTGNIRRATEHFAAAEVLHSSAGTPLLSAESLLDWAEALVADGGDEGEIRDLRERADRALGGREATLLQARLERLKA